MSLVIERVDPAGLDLDVADRVAEVLSASLAADGLPFQPRTGADVLTSRQLGFDSRPIDAVLLARDGDRVVAEATVDLPWRENTDSASVRLVVHPDARGRGVGGGLWRRVLEVVDEAGRHRVRTGAWLGTSGVDVLDHHGLKRTGVGVIRRLDLHATPSSTWETLHADAAAYAGDYELTRQAGSTPPEAVEDLVTLHAALNDAPRSDPGEQETSWDAQRLRDLEGAMAGRRQTVYRVLARHRPSGEPAGQSMVCVNEFSPLEAFQEDTSVVRTHRGHRLGLLMKAEMLRWLVAERPEVAIVDTWNDATNHHMIAINERLGARVVARHQGYTLSR
jgi:GNAT superfamily N-acetyltransferase